MLKIILSLAVLGAVIGLIFSRNGDEGDGILRGAKNGAKVGCFISAVILAVLFIIIVCVAVEGGL